MKMLFANIFIITIFLFSVSLEIPGLQGTEEQTSAPEEPNAEKREVNPESRNTACINGNCKPNKKTEKVNQKNKATNIAQKAAQEAKAASEAQQDAGQQAAHQVKTQLADKAEKAAEAAEAALVGKKAIVDQLQDEIHEAEIVVKDETTALEETQQHLQTIMHSAQNAAQLVKVLTGALKKVKRLIEDTSTAVEEAEQILDEKQQLVEAAKQRLQELKARCVSAHADMEKTKEAEIKAIQSAKVAHDNAERNRRKTHNKSEIIYSNHIPVQYKKGN